MDVIGMVLMAWGALATRAERRYGPGVLASGWAWTTATLWQPARGRYWMASQGMALYARTAELVVAPLLTVMALAVFGASLALVGPMARRDRRVLNGAWFSHSTANTCQSKQEQGRTAAP
jgi:hypothetical protein